TAMEMRARHEQVADLQPLHHQIEASQARLKESRRRVAGLTVTARQGGIWSGMDESFPVGRWLPVGSRLGTIIAPDRWSFMAVANQNDAADLFDHDLDKVEVRLLGQTDQVFPLLQVEMNQHDQRTLPSTALGWNKGGEVAVTQVEGIGVVALESFFLVHGVLPSRPPVAMIHGRAGHMIIHLPSRPLLNQWLEQGRQFVQKRYRL
ncbi:MAG: hypothetical protein G8345_17960, partial [Magnetococcales bacterium]|nr:hypothetical protein [Magnetococcales bacterium]